MNCRFDAQPAAWVTALLAAFLLPAFAGAAEDAKEGPQILSRWSHGVGSRVNDRTFTDLDGKPGRINNPDPTVYALTGVGCPLAKKYGPTLVQLEAAFRAFGVQFVLVNPDANESPAKLQAARRALKDQGFAGRYVHDPDLAAHLGAISSTEVFVIDAAQTLVYRGAIDDQYGLGYALPSPKHRYLFDALTTVCSGTTPDVGVTTAPGCVLDLKAATAAPTAPPAVTWHNQISRLMQRRCQECHRPGESGPFSLMSLEEAKDHLGMIRKVVSRGTMPPWYADAKVGHWANDRSLSESEKSQLLSWIQSGAPAGDAKDAPLPRVFTPGWQIGKPDAVFEATNAIRIPAKGPIPYQYALIPTNLDEDKWVQAVEIRTPHPQVTHHLLVFVIYPKDHPNAREQVDPRGGTHGYFAGMVPGQASMIYPDGTAKRLPKGATLLMQIHHTPDGTPVNDKPKIGFRFASKPPANEILTLAASNQKFLIPAGAPNHEVFATYRFKGDSRLTSFNPHSHVRGKAYRYELEYPDGKKETVLDIPHYDFNWQIEYHLAKPIDVPAGTMLRVTAWFDNSPANPANPDPTKDVKFGEQTFNEMMIGYFTGHRLK